MAKIKELSVLLGCSSPGCVKARFVDVCNLKFLILCGILLKMKINKVCSCFQRVSVHVHIYDHNTVVIPKILAIIP